MAWYSPSSLIHAAGNVVAPVAEVSGAAISPITGSNNSLTQLGHNISNPNVQLTNVAGTVKNNDPAFTGSGAYGTSSTKASSGSTSGTGSSSGSSGSNASTGTNYSSGSSASGSNNVAAINSAYNTLSNYYNGLLNTINPQQQLAQGQTDTQYNDNLQSLNDQLQSANANLDNQQNVVNQSYTKSLQQLANSIRNTAQGQMNALGVGGAGDSSAAFMLAHALADMQNENRTYMNQDMNNQLNQISLNRTSDQNTFNDQKKQLDDWKTQQYQNIGTQYANLAQQINEKLAGNEQYRQLALANAGAWAAGQAQSVDNTLQNSLNSLNSSYQNLQNPNISLGNLQTYQAQQIQTPQVSVSGAMNQTTTPDQVMQYVSPDAYKQDQTQNTFSY